MIADMPYAPEQKKKTRERILTEAARLFRRHGYDGVGIETIMAAARLTRGGFYAHFRSKADLFAAVLAGEPGFARRLRAARAESADGSAGGAVAEITAYLDPRHRDVVGRGCNMATLTGDVARNGRRARAAYTRGVRTLAAELEHHVSPDLPARSERALVALALSVGALTIARAVDDRLLADRLTAACARRATEEVTGRRSKSPGASSTSFHERIP